MIFESFPLSCRSVDETAISGRDWVKENHAQVSHFRKTETEEVAKEISAKVYHIL